MIRQTEPPQEPGWVVHIPERNSRVESKSGLPVERSSAEELWLELSGRCDWLDPAMYRIRCLDIHIVPEVSLT